MRLQFKRGFMKEKAEFNEFISEDEEDLDQLSEDLDEEF